MLKNFLLSVCLAVVIAHDEKSKMEAGINSAGNDVVNSSEFPFMAQLKLKEDGNLYHCSASIIAVDVLLTAAHCLDGRSPEDFIVFAGNDRKEAPAEGVTKNKLVQKFVIHEDYNNTYFPPRNDIGIIFLMKPLETTKFISPIEPATTYSINIGSKVTTIGWGVVNENGDKTQSLQETDMFLTVNNVCQDYLDAYALLYKAEVTDDMLCARNHDKTAVCEGDSGGPLIYRDKLIGISSYGFLKKFEWFGEIRCDTQYPAIFVKLSNYYD